MKVEKLLKRLKIEFVKVNLIQASLDSIIFFLVANIFFFLFSIRLVGSIPNSQIIGIATVPFFLADLFYRIRNYHLEIYEEKNPELKEILRTARDNLDKTNTASQALFDDLMNRARSVTSESIIPSRKIIQKIIIIGILSFLTVGTGLVDFQLKTQTDEIIPDLNLGKDGDKNLNGSEKGPEIRNGSEIYGEPSEIKITNKDLEFNITGTGASSDREFSFDRAQKEFSFETSDSSLDENTELAKRYSLAIKSINE